MKIMIAGKNFQIGNSLQEYVNEELTGVVTKYFENAIII